MIPERGIDLVLMRTEYSVPLNANNFFKRNQHVIERSAVIWALEVYSKQSKQQRDLSILKLLMKGCRDFKQLMNLFHYSNALNESIYHYSLTKEVCIYFEEELGVEFSIKMWGMQDSDGVTPLMRAMTLHENDQYDTKENMTQIQSGMAGRTTINDIRTNDKAVDFLGWVLTKCCINDEQRLWLIYRTANNGESVLDKTSGAVQRYLINLVVSMLESEENLDLESLIPIWLFSLKKSNIDLAKRLLGLVKDDSDRLELVSCRNEFGWSPILTAALSGNVKTLRFIEDTFQVNLQNFIDHRDHRGRTVMHYAVRSGSREMVKELLTLYMEETQYGDLMIAALKDENGNIPFSYFLKENGSPEMMLYLLNRFDDKQREEQRMRETVTSASGRYANRKVTVTERATQQLEYRCQSSVGSLARNIDDKIAMLFAKSKNGEIPLIEEYAVDMDMQMGIVSDYVYEYISSIKTVGYDNFEMVGYCLLFAAQRAEMTRMQLIIEKINGNDEMLREVLRIRNMSHHDALYRLVVTGKMRLFAWLLGEVPDDHECLFSQSLLRGDTTFMRLLEMGQMSEVTEALVSTLVSTLRHLKYSAVVMYRPVSTPVSTLSVDSSQYLLLNLLLLP